jgi:hypothetical protein
VLVIFGACAGLLYSSLWYFPTLIIIGGVVNCGWEMLLRNWTARLQRWWVAKRRPRSPAEADEAPPTDSVELSTMPADAAESLRKRNPSDRSSIGRDNAPAAMESEGTAPAQANSANPIHTVSIKVGLCIVFSVLGQLFVLSNVWLKSYQAALAAFLTARGIAKRPPLALNLFSSMLLAGCILFGGGPVVIPLLREYGELGYLR